ncbi:MAG: hypothetical protein HY828_13625 [Actinobacteria bacterium]|nr:hypothetical protein [Actinomycetota bacterium]
MSKSVATPRARRTATVEPVPANTQRFGFRFDGAVGVAARAFTATESRAYVEIRDRQLSIRFGPWTMSTPFRNIAEVVESGPYHVWKVIGPPRLSFADRGITFATNSERGVCIRFFDPVAGIEPTGRILHPGVTVTVADPDGLVVALGSQARSATTRSTPRSTTRTARWTTRGSWTTRPRTC